MSNGKAIKKDGAQMFIASDVNNTSRYKGSQKADSSYFNSDNKTVSPIAYILHPNGIGGVNMKIIGVKKPFSVVLSYKNKSIRPIRDLHSTNSTKFKLLYMSMKLTPGY